MDEFEGSNEQVQNPEQTSSPPFAFVVKPVQAVNACAFVVPAQDKEVLGVLQRAKGERQ